MNVFYLTLLTISILGVAFWDVIFESHQQYQENKRQLQKDWGNRDWGYTCPHMLIEYNNTATNTTMLYKHHYNCSV